MANFFQDIAQKYKLTGELVKQTLKTAAARNQERQVASQLAKKTATPTQPVSTGNFFSDVAKTFNIAKPAIDVKQQNPGFKRQAPQITEGIVKTMTSAPEVVNTLLNAPGDFAEATIKDKAKPGSNLFKAAPLIGLGVNVLTPGPGEFSKMKKLTEGELVSKIASETSPEQIRRYLLQLKVPTNRIKVLAEKLVEETDDNTVRSIIEETLSKPKPNYPKPVLPAPEEDEKAVQWLSDAVNKKAPSTKSRAGIPAAAEKGTQNAAIAVEREQAAIRKANAGLDVVLPPVQKKGLFTTLKGTLNPLSAVDDETKGIFKNYANKQILAKVKANEDFGLIGVGKNEGLDIIHRYERGTPTPYTEKIRTLFDNLYDEAKSRGIDLGYWAKTGYLPHVYKDTPEEMRKILAKFMEKNGVAKAEIEGYLNGTQTLSEPVANRLKLNPSFTKERTFPTYQDAIEAGLSPRFTNPDQLLAYYRHELEKTIANKELIDRLLAAGKVVPSEWAPTGYEPISLAFSQKGLAAEPRIARMINGIWRNEDNLGFFEQAPKALHWLSGKTQEISLSAGAPRTNLNFFSTGQLLVRLAAGEVKAIPAYIRANLTGQSIRFFEENAPVIRKMAEQGIDLGTRVGDYRQVYDSLVDQRGTWKKIGDRLGIEWNKAFNQKTFASFMPQLQIETFKNALQRGIAKGMTAPEAARFAADVTQNFYGLLGNVGRAKGTEDWLGAFFFAPKFREGILRTLVNTGRSVTTEIRNPAYYMNRRLFAGLVLIYGAYNLANKQLSGHYMWENPAGKEFELMIPMKNGDNVFISYMPSFFAFARNMGSGAIALGKGDFNTAGQKFGSVFSMPVKITSEVLSNRDYFGRQIYADTDAGTTKLKKIAEYVGLQVNHPYIREIYRQLTGQKPLYQSVSEALELPLKFQSNDQIDRNQFYEAMDRQTQVRADAKKRVQPAYDRVQALVKAGNREEAESIVNGLSDEDYEVYKDIKAADKRRATTRGEAEMFDTVLQVRDLVNQGKKEEAQAIVDSLSDEEYRLYKLAKKKLK